MTRNRTELYLPSDPGALVMLSVSELLEGDDVDEVIEREDGWK